MPPQQIGIREVVKAPDEGLHMNMAHEIGQGEGQGRAGMRFEGQRALRGFKSGCKSGCCRLEQRLGGGA